MLEELHIASALLKSAIDRYSDACLALTERPAGESQEFSGTIAKELEQVASYETKIFYIKSSLRKAKNHRVNIVPVNTLPPELLARIFFLAAPLAGCFLQDSTAFLEYPLRPPESLLHVCSYWRHVALNSHALWTHIDLAPHDILDKSYLGCGRMFAAQAGELPLTLHIDMSQILMDFPFESGLFETCISLANRAKCIKVSLPCPFRSGAFSIVEKLVVNSVPGKLSQLTLVDDKNRCNHGFLLATDTEGGGNGDTNVGNNGSNGDGHSGWCLDLPHHRLEELLCSVTVLHLSTLYFPWSSHAYRGLVKLRLSGKNSDFVTLSQFAGLLEASPELQFLHFSPGAKNDTTPRPVHLACLEVLHLEFDDVESQENVLRLIYPGSKPLRISTTFWHKQAQTMMEGEHHRLFSSANITQINLHSHEGGTFLYLFDLLEIVPNLRILSLSGFNLRRGYNTPATFTKKSPDSQLTRLYLAMSDISSIVIDWINSRYPVTEVHVDHMSYSTECDHPRSPRVWGPALAQEYLAVACFSSFRFAEEDWDC